MAELKRIQLDGGIAIYIEANEEITAPVIPIDEESTEEEKPLNARDLQQNAQQAIQHFTNLQDTIKAFAVYTLNSFKEIADANVDKVTLEFGVNIGGEAGIPYITKASVGSNLKITVECSFKPENAGGSSTE
jgi:hypothetical protein